MDTTTSEQISGVTLELPEWTQQDAASSPAVKVLAASTIRSAVGQAAAPDVEVVGTVDGG